MVEKNPSEVLGAVLLNAYLGRVIVLTITPIVWQLIGTWKSYKHCIKSMCSISLEDQY